MSAKCSENFILRGPDITYTETRGMGEVMFEAMGKHKDKVCQVNYEDGQEETYCSFNKRSIRVALSMRDKGIEAGDMICICSFNNMHTGVTYVAGAYLNTVMCFLDPTLSLTTTIHLLNISKPKMIFCGPEAVELLEKALKEVTFASTLVVYSDSTNHISFTDFLKVRFAEEESDFRPVKVASCKDTCLVLFSSGTTGYPKGLCIPHIWLLYSIARFEIMDVTLTNYTYFTSLYWATASMFFVLGTVIGGRRVVVPRFDPKTALKILEKYKVDYAFLANAYIPMLSLQPYQSYDLSCLKHIACGGSIMTEEQILLAKKMFPNGFLLYSWGMTECGYVTIFDPNVDKELMETKIGSVGKLSHGLLGKVVDIVTNANSGPKVVGEWRLKGECFLNGYYNQDSADAWDEDGWLKTGDLGYYDEDECIYLVGRIKELIKYQSWHVAPAIIEEVILKHPKVQETVVFGLPDDMDGEHPAALVVLSPDCGQISEQEIIDYVAEKVHDREKLRGGIKFVKQIPKSPAGKVLRYAIRNSWLKNEL